MQCFQTYLKGKESHKTFLLELYIIIQSVKRSTFQFFLISPYADGELIVHLISLCAPFAVIVHNALTVRLQNIHLVHTIQSAVTYCSVLLHSFHLLIWNSKVKRSVFEEMRKERVKVELNLRFTSETSFLFNLIRTIKSSHS